MAEPESGEAEVHAVEAAQKLIAGRVAAPRNSPAIAARPLFRTTCGLLFDNSNSPAEVASRRAWDAFRLSDAEMAMHELHVSVLGVR